MPLRNGRSQKTIGTHIAGLVDGCNESGHIGASHPETKQAPAKTPAGRRA